MEQRQGRIPCRRDGDLQVAYEAHGHGVELQIRRWDTGQTLTGHAAARDRSSSEDRIESEDGAYKAPMNAMADRRTTSR